MLFFKEALEFKIRVLFAASFLHAPWRAGR